MRKILVTLIKLAVTILVIGFFIRKYGWHDITGTVARARPGWLLLAVIAFFISGLLGVVQWRLLLARKGIRLAYGFAFKLYFMGMFFNNFIFGTVAADTVRVAYLKLSHESGRAGFGATFLDRFAGLLAMLGFATAGSIILLRRGLIEGYDTIHNAVIALFVTFILFGSILLFLVSKKLQRLFFSIYDRLPLPKKDFIRTALEQMLLEAGDFMLLVKVGLLSTGIQQLRIFVHILCGASLGLLTTMNFQYFFIFVPIMAIIMIIPLPFGIKEGVGATLYTMAGFRPEAALVMVFLATIVGILASSIGGIIFVTQRNVLSKNL
jgi:uncharacterized protein (TIRG00374 family)